MNDTVQAAKQHEENPPAGESAADHDNRQPDSASISCTYDCAIAPPSPPAKPAKSDLPTATAYRRPRQTANDHGYIDIYRRRHLKKLYPVIADFGNVLQVVLTVNRQQQPDPASAYSDLREATKNLLSELRKDKIITDKRCVWFCEFHKDGFPHFHVLLNSPQSVFSEIESRYELGFVRQRRFATAYDHLGYVTKQWSKSVVENLPEWVRHLGKRFDRFRTCNGFYGTSRKVKKPTNPGSGSKRPFRTIAEIQEEIRNDQTGDVWLKIPRRGKKSAKLNTAAIADRSELQRMFGTSTITIDRLANIKPTSPARREIVEALFRSFAPGYRTNSRKSLSIIAEATAKHMQLSADYGEPIKTATAEGLLVESAAA